MQKYTDSQITEALKKAMGVVAHAANALGTGRSTISDRIARNPELRERLDEIRETNLDIAESKLFELIHKGQPSAIIFYLKCIGKERGYVERIENTGKEGTDMMLPLLLPPQASNMEEWLLQNRIEQEDVAKKLPKASA